MFKRKFHIAVAIISAAAVFCITTDIHGLLASAASTGISGGTGTSLNPYIIVSGEGLEAISENPDADYRLGCDIDLNYITFKPLCVSGEFKGVFDGAHHTIKNLRVNSETDNAGLFSRIGNTGTVENLSIDNGQITASSDIAGSIAGENDGTIENCCNKAIIMDNNVNGFVGGIAASNSGSIVNCFNAGSLRGNDGNTVGGIAGQSTDGDIENCYNVGNISGGSTMGGIAGNGQCENCHFLAQAGLYQIGDGTSCVSGETPSKLKIKETYAGWNFNSIWTISDKLNNGYPCFVSLSGNADLSALGISAGNLSPAFNADIISYTAGVDNNVSNITVIPTASDKNATVKVNGGAADSAISLAVGKNIVTVTVTAQDGTVKNYLVVITRTPSNDSNNANLSALGISAGTLSPAFTADTLSYTVSVDYGVSNITVSPITADKNAAVKVNSGAAGSPIPLTVGKNTVTVTVTAQDGTVKNYLVVITRTPSSDSNNANLSALGISAGTLSPAFTADTLSYTVSVDYGVSNITVSPITADKNAAVKVNSGAAGSAISLAVGKNIVTVTVTAQDGTVKNYLVVITRTPSSDSNNANLSALGISAGTLDPAFNADTLSYTAGVDYGVSSITVTPTAADAKSVVFVNGNAVGHTAPLTVGKNTIAVTVVAQDGTVKTYTVAITRAPSSNADLSALNINAGILSPAFSADNLSYAASVDYSVSSITVLPTAADANSTVFVNGNSASNSISLVVGKNTVTVTVIAQNGTVKTYTIVITRAPSSNADLNALYISVGTLNHPFNADNLYYTAGVDYSVSSITVTAAADINATVFVNGNANGSSVSLKAGKNIIMVTVIAQDGTVRIYTVEITRDYCKEITAAAPDDDGAYTAATPEYLPLLSANDTLSFVLGNVDVSLPVWQIRNGLGTGTVKISQKSPPQSTAVQISSYIPDNTAVEDAFTLETSGGTATIGTPAAVTLRLNSDISALLPDNNLKIYYYEPTSHTFTDMNAVFDKSNATALFKTTHFGTFIVAAKTVSAVLYHYTLSADSCFASYGTSMGFNLTASRDKGSAPLYGGQLLIVTTLKSGSQTFLTIPISGNVTTQKIMVNKDAVKSSVYLIKGDFNGRSIPTTYSLTKTVTNNYS